MGVRGRNITKGKRQGCSGYISSTQLLLKPGWVTGNQVRDDDSEPRPAWSSFLLLLLLLTHSERGQIPRGAI